MRPYHTSFRSNNNIKPQFLDIFTTMICPAAAMREQTVISRSLTLLATADRDQTFCGNRQFFAWEVEGWWVRKSVIIQNR